MRQTFVFGFLSFCLLTLATPAAEPPALAGRRPNIILILTDDQGYGDVAAHGNPFLKTPNMDKLYAESVRFSDYHVSPTCAPTRSTLMTGRHEFKNGVTHTILERERLTPSAITLAQVLKKCGYTSAIFGKWHLGDEDEYQPQNRGFDEAYIHGAGGIGQTYKCSCGDAPKNSYYGPTIRHNGVFEKTDDYCTDAFFKKAESWIESVKGKQPFYCHLATNAPHAPYNCPPGSEKRFVGKVPADTAQFYGMIENIDDNIGKLLAKLKDWGIAENTLLIFMTDNGSAAGWKTFNAGMRGGKGTQYLGGTRVPLYLYWPGTLSPREETKFACGWDYFPTLAELAGAKLEGPVAEQVEGRSLVPLLQNPDAPWPDRYFFSHVGRWAVGTDVAKSPEKTKYGRVAVRYGQYTLVHEPSEDKNKTPFAAPHWALYDLKADFGQQTDVAAEHPEQVKAMLAAYDQFWDSLLPKLVNENAAMAPMNPFHAAYWRQYKGPGPNNAPPPPDFDY
jgi:arylsulfatase A-like enzyme